MMELRNTVSEKDKLSLEIKNEKKEKEEAIKQLYRQKTLLQEEKGKLAETHVSPPIFLKLSSTTTSTTTA